MHLLLRHIMFWLIALHRPAFLDSTTSKFKFANYTPDKMD